MQQVATSWITPSSRRSTNKDAGHPVVDFLSHPIADFREAAAELARKDRVLKQSSQNRFTIIGNLLQMSTAGCPASFSEFL